MNSSTTPTTPLHKGILPEKRRSMYISSGRTQMLPSKASKKLTLGMTGVYAQQRWDNNDNNTHTYNLRPGTSHLTKCGRAGQEEKRERTENLTHLGHKKKKCRVVNAAYFLPANENEACSVRQARAASFPSLATVGPFPLLSR